MYTWWDSPNIFEEMQRARNEFENYRRSRTPGHSQGVYPPVNVTDDGENYYVRAEVPGLDKDSLEVTATQDGLVISGERPREDKEGVSYHRRERDHGTFNRSFQLPQAVDPSKIKASYEKGILEITVPRAAEAKPRKIKIKA